MFAVLGSLLDRFWPHLITAIGTVALALFGTVWQESGDVIGDELTIGLIIIAALVSAAGAVIAAIRYDRGVRGIQTDMLTDVRASLVPLCARLIMLPRPLEQDKYVDAMTELTMHCRLFAPRDPGTIADANFYALSGNTLTRVNRAAGSAREQFVSGRRTTPRALEEKAVVDRIKAGQSVVCGNIRKRKQRRLLCLEEGDRTYLSFVSVPVISNNGTIIGMLSLNSSEKNGLSSVHATFLESVAKLIAAVHAVNP